MKSSNKRIIWNYDALWAPTRSAIRELAFGSHKG